LFHLLASNNTILLQRLKSRDFFQYLACTLDISKYIEINSQLSTFIPAKINLLLSLALALPFISLRKETGMPDKCVTRRNVTDNRTLQESFR